MDTNASYSCNSYDMCLTLISSTAVAFAQVDWHDFVVVETVDFKDSETGGHFHLQGLAKC